ncbi:hypothetical protein L484_009730 [Morus notabilis]|uniref:Uncharacterized protein n=1 Tax=Morus notabilis TaxID=981085 RepID=W9QXX9_9ROSA|nr:hypothetical protein L484_009730 [Morus notabilis]
MFLRGLNSNKKKATSSETTLSTKRQHEIGNDINRETTTCKKRKTYMTRNDATFEFVKTLNLNNDLTTTKISKNNIKKSQTKHQLWKIHGVRNDNKQRKRQLYIQTTSTSAQAARQLNNYVKKTNSSVLRSERGKRGEREGEVILISTKNEQYWAGNLRRKAVRNRKTDLYDGGGGSGGKWGKPKPVQKAVGFGSDGRQRLEDA